jgi:hypothetical protein
VCTLLLYFLEGGGGSNWLTIVGLSSSKYLEHMLFVGADHRLAYSATGVSFGQLQGDSRVCTLLVYLWSEDSSSKWITIVGLSSSKFLEHVL